MRYSTKSEEVSKRGRASERERGGEQRKGEGKGREGKGGEKGTRGDAPSSFANSWIRP